MTETKELYDLGHDPPLGHVPARMHAWVIRRDRHGEPLESFRCEVVEVPEVGDGEVLVYVKAAGVNYNSIWAGRGQPVEIIPQGRDSLISGSDGSGVVYKVGRNVTNVRVGDEVVLAGIQWDPDCPYIRRGGDPCFSDTYRVHGYQTSWGTFAQFSLVQAHQCLPKPPHLTWEAAASYLVSGFTSYRMLHRWGEHAVRPDDVVLVWGGAGGLGCQAIQLAKQAGAHPIAVVSDETRARFCERLGAIGCIDRTQFGHWGPLPHWSDHEGYETWLRGNGGKPGAVAFGREIWKIFGERRSPRIVVEHPGEHTLPTSLFICATGGMVVCCAGTSGYSPVVDLRYLWMRQKSIQGSHGGNLDDAQGINDLVISRRVDPCLSRTFPWRELPFAHQLMAENRHPPGNMAVLVSSPAPGLGVSKP